MRSVKPQRFCHLIHAGVETEARSASRTLGCFVHKRPEQTLRKQIVLPTKFRVPLNGDDELIRSRIFQRFDNTVSGPRCGNEIRADRLDRLVMMAVDECINRACDV